MELNQKTIGAFVSLGQRLKLTLGEPAYCDEDWIHPSESELDLLDREKWNAFMGERVASMIHVVGGWERLDFNKALDAARICFDFLEPAGHLRVVLPDKLCPTSPQAMGHQTYAELRKIFETVGFRCQVIEFFDENGTAHRVASEAMRGAKSSLHTGAATGSLIIDAFRVPLISIITVCRNEGWRIRQTIESVLFQSCKDIELIVIDGASTDGTSDILSEYSERFAYFVSEPDSGIYNAQNKGFLHARGKYVLFLNGGDFLTNPNVLESILPSLRDNNDIVYGDLVIRNSTGGSVLARSPDHITLEHMVNATLWHPASFIKRALFIKHGPYDENYKICADYDFFLRVICVHNVSIKYIPVAVTTFNLAGIGSDPANNSLHQSEREKAQLKYFSPKTLDLARVSAGFRRELVTLHGSLPQKMARQIKRRAPGLANLLKTLIETAWLLMKKLDAL